MADVSFRDFAAALMQGKQADAAALLARLLGLAAPDAAAATAHFSGRMKDPAFMTKAMSLRTAVTSGSDDDIDRLLADCFGLDAAHRPAAIAALRKRYPAS
jgi:hypothetical protein